jgi:hypothetical protein
MEKMRHYLSFTCAALLACALYSVGPCYAQSLSVPPPPCGVFGTTTGTCLQGAGALGTPSSGSAANLTSIPVAQATGVLPFANGGRGVATQPQAQGARITSNFTISNATWVTVQLNQVLDPNTGSTATGWDGVNFWFLPTTAGTYMVCGVVNLTGTTVSQAVVGLSKNGRITGASTDSIANINVGLATTANQGSGGVCRLFSLNGSSDTIELDVLAVGTGTIQVVADRGTSFSVVWVHP